MKTTFAFALALAAAALLIASPTTAEAKKRHEPPACVSVEGYYTNVDGREVHRPRCNETHDSLATALCRDGTESYSKHHSGTCSGHGGVAEWYR